MLLLADQMKLILVMAILAGIGNQGAECTCKRMEMEGPVEMRARGAGSCHVERKNQKTFIISSPGFPADYTGSDGCTVTFSAKGSPQYLQFTPLVVSLSDLDLLSLQEPFKVDEAIVSSSVGSKVFSPSAFTQLLFKPGRGRTSKRFQIEVRLMSNKCQRVCKLTATSKGVLKQGPHAANTYCQWWLKAPKGCTIKLSFRSLDVGEHTVTRRVKNKCQGDYLGVDMTGSSSYRSGKTVTFCAASTPSTPVMSLKSELAVLFNGVSEGKGFYAVYSVKCNETVPVSISSLTAASVNSSSSSGSSSNPSPPSPDVEYPSLSAKPPAIRSPSSSSAKQSPNAKPSSSVKPSSSAKPSPIPNPSSSSSKPSPSPRSSSSSSIASSSSNNSSSISAATPAPVAVKIVPRITESCPPSFSMVKGVGCVYASSERLSWDDAQKYCQNRGAKLYHLTSQDASKLLHCYLATINKDEYYWVGAQYVSGIWKWVTGDGSTLDNSLWSITDSYNCPNDGVDYQCVDFASGTYPPLCDVDCNDEQNFVCLAPTLKM